MAIRLSLLPTAAAPLGAAPVEEVTWVVPEALVALVALAASVQLGAAEASPAASRRSAVAVAPGGPEPWAA